MLSGSTRLWITTTSEISEDGSRDTGLVGISTSSGDLSSFLLVEREKRILIGWMLELFMNMQNNSMVNLLLKLLWSKEDFSNNCCIMLTAYCVCRCNVHTGAQVLWSEQTSLWPQCEEPGLAEFSPGSGWHCNIHCPDEPGAQSHWSLACHWRIISWIIGRLAQVRQARLF